MGAGASIWCCSGNLTEDVSGVSGYYTNVDQSSLVNFLKLLTPVIYRFRQLEVKSTESTEALRIVRFRKLSGQFALQKFPRRTLRNVFDDLDRLWTLVIREFGLAMSDQFFCGRLLPFL